MRGALVGILLLAACRDGVGANPAIEVARFQRHKDLWEAAGPASYSVTVRVLCGECTPDMLRPVIVTVTNGQVASRVYADDGTLVSDGNAWPDVDGLFEIVADAIVGRAYRLAVSYDATLGFPRSISIDYDENSVDDEIGYAVTNFTPR